jgi:hypothetical protein
MNQITEGPDYKSFSRGYTWERVCGGTLDQDRDSAQCVVVWQGVDQKGKKYYPETNAVSGATRKEAAQWNYSKVTIGENTWNDAYADFYIPPGYTNVNVLLLYTDVLEGTFEDTKRPGRGDLPLVIASWEGSQSNGVWSFKALSDNPYSQLANYPTAAQIGQWTSQIQATVINRTYGYYQLDTRRNGGSDTGFDIARTSKTSPYPQ